MPRISGDVFKGIVGKRVAPEEAPIEGVRGEEVGEETKIEDEGEWKARVDEILTEARDKIEAITPPELMDRIDDEIRAAAEVGKAEEIPEGTPEGIEGL